MKAKKASSRMQSIYWPAGFEGARAEIKRLVAARNVLERKRGRRGCLRPPTQSMNGFIIDAIMERIFRERERLAKKA